MERIIDYVRWYSDISLTTLPFNEVDNLVFCALSYWKFPDMNWGHGKHTLRECYEKLHGDPVEMKTTDTDDSMAEFVRCAAESRRFGDLLVSDYVEEFYPEVPIQFSAVTFHIPRILSASVSAAFLRRSVSSLFISATDTSICSFRAVFFSICLWISAFFPESAYTPGNPLTLRITCSV